MIDRLYEHRLRYFALFLLSAFSLSLIILQFHCSGDLHICITTILKWFTTPHPMRPVLFIFLYSIATVLLIPGSLLTMGAGIIFGFQGGILTAISGAAGGAMLSFLASRYFLKEDTRHFLKKQPFFSSLHTLITHADWKLLLLSRLSPLFPFTLLNYAFGLSHISFVAYSLVSLVGMLPGTLLYVYGGVLLGSLAQLRNGAELPLGGPVKTAVTFLGFGATLGIVLWVGNLAGKKLKADSQRDRP